jgi:hypothetical protein
MKAAAANDVQVLSTVTEGRLPHRPASLSRASQANASASTAPGSIPLTLGVEVEFDLQ